jgi:hypothetical protein
MIKLLEYSDKGELRKHDIQSLAMTTGKLLRLRQAPN